MGYRIEASKSFSVRVADGLRGGGGGAGAGGGGKGCRGRFSTPFEQLNTDQPVNRLF